MLDDTSPPRPYRGRFAPSPTGPLHAGSLVAALGSWLIAHQAGGRWLIRIEDVDRTREIAGAADDQLSALHRLGLQSDGPVVRQSARDDLYAAALERLLATGDAFVCHCSRRDLAAHGGLHRACVAQAHRPDPSIRLRVPPGTRVAFVDRIHGRIEQDLHAEVGDFVLRRADGFWAYQLAVVVDDADQAITDIVRGTDLIDSTPRQILLQQRLGLPTPTYAHLPLVLDADGRKLSKSLDALPVATGDPYDALAFAWAALGQTAFGQAGDRPLSWLAQAVERFDTDRIPRAPRPALAASHNAFVADDA